MIARLMIVLFLAVAPTSAASDVATVRDRIVRELRDDGYAEIRITRTFLGRMRFVASDSDRRREIVVNPRTGVILRDYLRFLRNQSGSSSSGTGGGQSFDDDDEDDEDEDEDDDEDDDEDNSGRGSDDEENDDEDDDDEDNSGSGSSNSGSGSDDDEDDDD